MLKELGVAEALADRSSVSDRCCGGVPQHGQIREVVEAALDDLVGALRPGRRRRDDDASPEDVDRQREIGPDRAALVGPPIPGLVIAAAGAHDERRGPMAIERIRENALVGRVDVDDHDPRALGLQPECRLLAEPLHELLAARQPKGLVALDRGLLAAHRKGGDALLGVAGLPLGEGFPGP